MSSEDPLASVDASQIKIEDSEASPEPAAPEETPSPKPSTGAGDRNSAMRTEIPSGSWEQQWEKVKTSIHASNPPITVVVSSPELISSFMSKYVVYTVKTEPLGYAVRRRYNDFQWLRESLISRYVGLYVPMLPATSKATLTGKTDLNGNYVKNRMAQLNLFVQQINKIPFLRTDPAWIQFISVQGDKDFEQITKQPIKSTSEEETDTSSNAGLVAWMNMLEKNQVSGDSERIMTDVRRQLDILTKTLVMIDKDCRNTGSKALQCSRAMDNLSINIGTWNTSEHELLDPARNEYLNANGQMVKQHMGALVDCGNQLSLNLSMIPKIIARVLISGVQFQLQQVEGFRQHLDARAQAYKDLDSAEKQRVSALAEKQRAQAAGPSPKRGSVTSLFTKKTDELDEDLRKKSEKVKNLENICTNMTKAVLFSEIARFNNERAQSTAYLLGSLAATNLQISQAGMSKWSEIMQQSGMDINAEDFNAVLNSALDDGDAVFGDV